MTEPEDGALPTAVEDPDGFSKGRRLRTIHNRLDAIGDDEAVLRDAVADGRLSDPAAREHYRAAIKRALKEIEPIATRDRAPDDVRALWSDETLGEFTITAPDSVSGYGPGVSVAWDTPAVDVTVSGLRDVLQLPSPLAVTFRGEVSGPHTPPQAEAVEKTAELPWPVLETAERRTKKVVHELDMGVGETSKKRVAELKYSHLYPGGSDE